MSKIQNGHLMRIPYIYWKVIVRFDESNQASYKIVDVLEASRLRAFTIDR